MHWKEGGKGQGKMQTCGPADRPTGKLQTKSVNQVRSLPFGQFTGPHYLHKSFFTVADVCIITALNIAYLSSITCHMAPVICATPATLPSRHLSRKDVGRTATALTKSPESSARTAAAGIIAAVRDTSAENLFANSVDNFLLTSNVSLA